MLAEPPLWLKATPAAPGIERRPARTPSDLPRALTPRAVLLHNDDHHDMLYVVQSLVRSVPPLGRRRAVTIMLEAHNQGKARVITCPLEEAELYRDRLLSCGLTATIDQG